MVCMFVLFTVYDEFSQVWSACLLIVNQFEHARSSRHCYDGCNIVEISRSISFVGALFQRIYDVNLQNCEKMHVRHFVVHVYKLLILHYHNNLLLLNYWDR